MALGPDVLKKLNEATIKEMEALIDEAIKSARPGTTTIYVTPPAHFSTALMPTIKELYTRAGWRSVKYFSGQRDGDSIILSTELQ